MRIFIASGIFDPEPGGPATYLKYFLPELQTRGYDVTVITYGNAPVDGYPYALTRIPRRFYLARQSAYYMASARLWSGHDLAYVHSLGLPLPAQVTPRIGKIVGDPAWERAMNRGWVSPDTDIDQFQIEKLGVRAEINKWLRSMYARRLDHIIVPSAYLKNMVVNWGVAPEKISVVYNALHHVREHDDLSMQDARSMLNLPDRPILLIAARLTSWKGVDHVLRAIHGVPDVHLVIAGDGPMRPNLENLTRSLKIKHRVHFPGRVSRSQMPLYYRAADYTVLYSGYEGLPHVLLESLQMGTPVIASDKGGNPEVVRHGINGLLVPYIDVDTLQQTFHDALSGDRRDQLAAQSSTDTERFQWETMVANTVEILERFS